MENLNEEQIIKERKEKAIKYIKNNPNFIFIFVLILLVILGVYIRYQPLTDHGGRPGLWDITTNDYTLGPDLDPFLFLRYASEIVNGSFDKMDMMRNVPLGFDTSTELQMVSYFIVITYRALNMLGNYSINYAGAFMPVWVFALTIIAFFLFVREIFSRKEKESKIKANLIASISTFFMIIMPAFLSRTVAGIPEKESIGFLFMFLSFFLFLRAWKSEKIRNASIFGILAGISTGLMGLTWGGVTIVYLTIAIAGLAAFILNKIKIKESLIYALWLISSAVVYFAFTNRISVKDFVFGLDTGISVLVLAIIIFHYLLWNTKLKNFIKIENIKLPKTVITILIILIVGLIGALIIDYNYILNMIDQLYHRLITPVTGRWNTTVAENRQPYFVEWVASFGKTIFWLFFISSAALFYKMFSKLRKKETRILTAAYILFFFGLVFSRYEPSSILNGVNFVSKVLYFGAVIIFAVAIIFSYLNYYKKSERHFEEINFDYILLFILFFITLASARGAVRLIMVLVPIAPIFIAYLIIELFYKINKTNENTKIIVAGLAIIITILVAYQGYHYYNSVKSEANSYVPYYYTFQWQEAMKWVRDNTATDSVFAHWWDYGYWVQSIGKRATVTDGGNAIVWWNYLTGRLVLTGDNQKDALEFLWNHKANYLLIDSSDIGKYGAFSQIGSDANLDRLSMGPITMITNSQQTKETKESIVRVYQGNGNQIEEDLIYENNGTKITLFRENTGLMGIISSFSTNKSKFEQPTIVFSTNGKQVNIPARYVYYNNTFIDFKTGIEAAVYIIPKLDATQQGLSIDNSGALIYLSPRILRGLLGQLYLLDNSFGNFKNFEVAHTEPDFIIRQISEQTGMAFPDFVYYQGLRGPIKIWKIKYTGQEKENKEHVQKQVPDYITWKF